MPRGSPRNVAVTDLPAFMVTVQRPLETASQPLQPVKTDLDAGAAISVTMVPLEYD